MNKKEKRLFKKSDYEKTFKDRFVQRYRGIDIYWYINVIDYIGLTFWYGPESDEHISSLSTLRYTKEQIDIILNEREFECQNLQ